MKLDTFTRAYIGTALWSSTDYAHDACPCCGKTAILSHYPEPEYEAGAVCFECGAEETENPESLDSNYSALDIAPETLKQMQEDCEAFQRDNAKDLETVTEWCDDSRAGHNFWLNRNGHGAGFWDEYFGENEELRAAFNRLSDASKAFGTYDLYVGDDGQIHGS